MTKHRRTRRRGQKGGFLGFGESSEPSVQQPQQSSDQGFFSGISNFFSGVGKTAKEGLNSANQYIGDTAEKSMNAASAGVNSVTQSVSSLNPLGSSSTTNANAVPPTGTGTFQANNTNVNPVPSTGTVSAMGGRRRKRCRSMKGGKGGLGLTYYAAPVDGLKVAEPTSWQFYANGVNQYSVKGGSRKRRARKSRRTRRHKRR